MIVWSVVVGPWFKLWNVCQAAMASRQVHSCAPPEGGMRAASCALVLLGRRRCIESRPWAQQRRAGRWCCRLAIAGLACHPLGLGGSLRLPSLTEPRLRPRALRPAPLGLLASSSSPPHADAVLRDGAPLVVYEDEDFLVVDKVKCLVKSPHPTGGVCNSKD